MSFIGMHKVVNAMKHVLHFSVDEGGAREFAVETDDLRDIASWPWFRDFLAIRGEYVLPMRDGPRDDSRIEELRAMVLEQNRKVQAYAEENKRLEDQMRQMQAFIDAQPPLPPSPAVQQAMMPPPRQPGPQGQVDPFSLNPDQMTEAMWKSMAPQVQDQWLKKWGINQ